MAYQDEVAKLLEKADAVEAARYRPDIKCFLRPVLIPDGKFIVAQDEAKSPSKIIYAAQKNKARPTTGRVIAVTEGYEEWIGKRVFYGMMSGTAIKFKNSPVWVALVGPEIIAEITADEAEIDQDTPLPLDGSFA